MNSIAAAYIKLKDKLKSWTMELSHVTIRDTWQDFVQSSIPEGKRNINLLLDVCMSDMCLFTVAHLVVKSLDLSKMLAEAI